MRWLVVVMLVTSVACTEEDPVLWQGHAAEAMRELSLKDAPEVRRFSRQEWSDRAAASADTISDATLQRYADTYGRLGYFAMDLDLRPVFAGSSSDWVGASYSPGGNVISLIGEARDDTIVHEYVHALQDDYFDIAAYDLPTSDGFLARRSVVEGDAVVAQLRFVANQQVDGDLDTVDWASVLGARRDFSAQTLSDAAYPVVFLDYVSLVYTYGFEYMAHNLTGVRFDAPLELADAPYDWDLANQMFSQRRPEYTEQILNRDLLVAEGDDPVFAEVGLRAVPENLSDRLTDLDWDSLGRWYVYLLLYPLEQNTTIDASVLAAGWDGDNVLFVIDKQNGEGGVVWAARWDDDAAAQGIVDALWLVHGYTPVKGQPAHVGVTDAGELAWIERRGNQIVMAINITTDIVSGLVDQAFAEGIAAFGGRVALKRRFPSLAETLDRARRARKANLCANLAQH